MLVHFALWFHEVIEPIDAGRIDDWGYNDRDVIGGTELSNHAAGLAIDLNALKHQRGLTNTFQPLELRAIHRRLYHYHAVALDLRLAMPPDWDSNTANAVIRWGQDYHKSPVDGMHFEWNRPPSSDAQALLWKHYATSPRGKRIRKANAIVSE
jgi:hypothetical protein